MVGNPLTGLGGPATAVRGQYFVREPLQAVTELIYSWPTTQLPLVEQIADALPRCSTVKATTSVRTTATLTVKQLQIPGLRDGIALRIETVMSDMPTRTFAHHDATVVRGGTVLRISGLSETFRTDAAFVELLTKAVARLDTVG